MLIFNIENFTLVDESNAKEIQQWVKGETTLIDLKNTDHLLSDRKTSTDVTQQITDWLDNF